MGISRVMKVDGEKDDVVIARVPPLHPAHERFVQLLIDPIAAVHARHPRRVRTRPETVHHPPVDPPRRRRGVPGNASRPRRPRRRRRRSPNDPGHPGVVNPAIPPPRVFHPARDVPPRQSPRGPRARRIAPSPPRERDERVDIVVEKSRRRYTRARRPLRSDAPATTSNVANERAHVR